MFPFDPSALPQITARRAFIGVDFQQAFTTAGALPVVEPEGYVDRACALATAFREAKADVIWIRSEFDQSRSVNEQIIVSDDLKSSASDSAAKPEAEAEASQCASSPDAEAFLGQDNLASMAQHDLDWIPSVAASMAKSDLTLTKTEYSAFQGTQLLRLLRAKMVMEVFICGSLANIGVYATAMDAAGHGLSITVVEDCCGYRFESRQRRAVQNLIQFTGCEVASAAEAHETIHPPAAAQRPTQTLKPKSVPEGVDAREAGRTAISPDIVRPMTGLKLVSTSPDPSDQTQTRHTHAAEATAGTSDESSIVAADIQTQPTHSSSQSHTEKEPESNLIPSATTSLIPHEEAAGKKNSSGSNSSSPSQDELHEPQIEHDVSHKSPPLAQESALGSSRDERTGEEMSRICEGDTDVITDLLPKDLEDGIFDTVRNEVKWQRMSHQGGDVPRLVAVQGQVADDGSIPIYRHPSDESPPLLPFSRTVLAIKAVTEARLGHPLNHVLIQFYRDGNDFISEHSDKTLDIVSGSYIANVSLGAERTMVLRTKRLDKDPSRHPDTAVPDEGDKRRIHRARLPHNSLLRMGLKTNMKWLHSIRQDKRAQRDKTAAELAFNGARISLTFRQIGTFLSKDEKLIWGQGALAKTCDTARSVVNGQGPEAIGMLKAFGIENHATSFDWATHYGKGFDVLHMSASPRFFASQDPIMNLRVALILAELGVTYARGSMGPIANRTPDEVEPLPMKFVDNDDRKSTVEGDVAILMYLDATYGGTKNPGQNKDQALLAKRYTRFQQALSLSLRFRQGLLGTDGKINRSFAERELPSWDRHVAEADGEFLVGSIPSLPDFVVWPILHALVQEHGLQILDGQSDLKKYYEVFGTRECVRIALGKAIEVSP